MAGDEGFHLTFGSEQLLLVVGTSDAASLQVEDDWVLLDMVDEVYKPARGDFGPLNLGQIHRCVKAIDSTMKKNMNSKIVYYVRDDAELLTNAVLVLGCYRIIIRGDSPDEIWSDVDCIEPYLETYRDASKGESDFDISLLDCWRALVKAKDLGWIERVDVREYNHYINHLEGDLHIVIPDELVAFREPVSLCGEALFADVDGVRHFSPKFYASGPFSDMNVRIVIRLSPREYDESEFEEDGIRCEGLEFDGPLPPPDVVSSFLHLLRTARDRGSASAVHCSDTGLGRVGTLCALYLMSSYCFSAREAVAWMRIMRPGSVVGDQQHLLCAIEKIAEPFLQQEPSSFHSSFKLPSDQQDSFDLLAMDEVSCSTSLQKQAALLRRSHSWSTFPAADPDDAKLLDPADGGGGGGDGSPLRRDAILDVGKDMAGAGVPAARARQQEIWRALAIHRGVSRAVAGHRAVDHVRGRRRPESPVWSDGGRRFPGTVSRTGSAPP